MDIHFLDKESLMVLITCRSPFQGEKLNELLIDIQKLKEQDAMGFIFDFSHTPFISTGGISLLGVLGAEAVMGNDMLRIICPNPKFRRHFEMAGLLSVAKFLGTVPEAVQDLKSALFIEDDLPEPIVYKQAQLQEAPSSADPSKEPVPQQMAAKSKDSSPDVIQTDIEIPATPSRKPAPQVPASTSPPPPKKLDPPPPSEAEPDETLPLIFKVSSVAPEDVVHPYLMPSNRDTEKYLQAELKHLSTKMKKRYESLSEKCTQIITQSPDYIRSQRAYPCREWVRTFAVVQGNAPKNRHLLVGIGAYLQKKAKTLSYSAAQALDQYEFSCYFVLGVLESCTLYGENVGFREAHGWKYSQYSGRDPKAQELIMNLLEDLLKHVHSKK